MKDFIPAEWRKTIYGVFAVAGLGLGAAQVGYSSAGFEQPTWLTVAMAVYGFLAAGIGYTAASNTVTPTASVEGIPQVAEDDNPEAVLPVTEFTEVTPKHAE